VRRWRARPPSAEFYGECVRCGTEHWIGGPGESVDAVIAEADSMGIDLLACHCGGRVVILPDPG